MIKYKHFACYLLAAFAFIFLLNSPKAIGVSKKLKIMMINWRVETEASQGFKDGMAELGYDVEYKEFIVHKKSEILSEFLKTEFKPQDYDYIYTYGTSTSKLVYYALNGTTPQIFTMVSFPVKSGLVKSFDKPGKNCTGSTHFVPVELQIQVALDIFRFKTLLMIFNPKELNSNITRNEIIELSKKYKFNFESLRVNSEKTMKEILRKIRSREISSDVVYLPSDSMITTNIDPIVKTLKDIKQLHFTALKRDIESGALLGLVNDYYKTGKAAALIVDEHQKGKPFQEIPVKRFDDPSIFVNKATADALNFVVPEKFKSRIKFIDH